MKLRFFQAVVLFGILCVPAAPMGDTILCPAFESGTRYPVPQSDLGQESPKIVGTWTGNMTMADGGNNALTMVITSGEEGYAGTIRDEEGLMPEGTELADIDLTADKLTFNITTPDLAPINFTLTVGLKSMLGRWEDPTNSTNGTVEFKTWK